MSLTLLLSAALGTIVAVSCFVAVIRHEDRYDWIDRLCLAGLGGSMLLTTPAIFWTTPFDAWSFNLSRAFLAGIFLKRFIYPWWVEHQGTKRQGRAVSEALGRQRGAGLHDRAKDWL